MEKIKIKVTTQSNLFIGGNPSSFEIGGIDLYTITDYLGNPFIPASSFKGILRKIVRDLSLGDTDSYGIKVGYKNYLEQLQARNQERIKNLNGVIEAERLERMRTHFDEAISAVSEEYLFGIRGMNDTPKLILNDLVLDSSTSTDHLFSIDTKNEILLAEDSVMANPRTYKTVRPGVTFVGDILFYRLEELHVSGIREFIEQALLAFNKGIYRLGNSGSRGYGRIQMEILQECE